MNHLNGQRQDFRHHLSNGGRGTLANVSGTGVDRDAAVHVNLDVHGGVWEILRVPMDGKSGT